MKMDKNVKQKMRMQGKKTGHKVNPANQVCPTILSSRCQLSTSKIVTDNCQLCEHCAFNIKRKSNFYIFYQISQK